MQESNDRVEARVSKWVPRRPGGNPSGRFETLRARWRASVWQPVVVKSLSVCAGMVGLAAIGIFSALGAPELQSHFEADDPSAPAASIEEATWLAGMTLPTPAAKPTRSNREPGLAHAESTSSAMPSPPAEPSIVAGSASAPPQDEDGNPTPPGVTVDGKVILNTASAHELQRLPGVGEKRAEKIVELRTRIKRFRKATDLLRVRGIGVKSLRKMLPHLVVDPPPPPEPEPAPTEQPPADQPPQRPPEAATPP